MAFLPIPLVKLSGAGNTFVVVDATKTSSWQQIENQFRIKRNHFAKMVCDKILGVSADGVLFLNDGDTTCDYIWDFYNADGSTAEMCGNAARCAALFANRYLSADVRGSYRFKTGAGVVTSQILGDDRVRVAMPTITAPVEQKTLLIEDKEEQFAFVNSGVPHLVKALSNYREVLSLKEWARKARHHKDLGIAGANVTFYAPLAIGGVQAVTFERGVEDFTPACGTGAVAVAYVEYQKNKKRNLDVHMPGGTLEVQFPENASTPFMTGPAVFVIEFQYFYEVMG